MERLKLNITTSHRNAGHLEEVSGAVAQIEGKVNELVDSANRRSGGMDMKQLSAMIDSAVKARMAEVEDGLKGLVEHTENLLVAMGKRIDDLANQKGGDHEEDGKEETPVEAAEGEVTP